MAIDIVPRSLYPFVPRYLGVPTLLRQGAQILDTLTLGYLGLGDALNSIIGSDTNRWGVFDSAGARIAEYDSVFAVGYRNESRISDYPVENGGFASYNKVDNPFDIVVTLTCAGSDDTRAAFLVRLETARASLQLYTVVTPEYTYTNVNFPGLDFRRERENGANILIVTMHGRQIRNTASSAFAAPLVPSSNSIFDQGQIKTIEDPTIDASGLV